MAALTHSFFWKDTQNVFTYPQYAGDLGQYATLELGPTGVPASTTAAHAEGGFQRKFMDGEGGVYLGHYNNAVFTDLGGTGVQQQNPFYFYYGTGAMGFGLNLSYSKANSTGNKDLGIGATFGMKAGDINIGVVGNIYTKAGTDAANTKVLPEIELNVNDAMGNLWIYGQGTLNRVDNGTSATGYGVTVGAQDHAFKLGQTGTFYYGADIGYTKVSDANKSFSLPLYAGLEADVASWAVLRGSVSQTLFGYTDNGTNKDFNGASTLIAAGMGIKVSNFDIDALLEGAQIGKVNGVAFASNLGITYHL